MCRRQQRQLIVADVLPPSTGLWQVLGGAGSGGSRSRQSSLDSNRVDFEETQRGGLPLMPSAPAWRRKVDKQSDFGRRRGAVPHIRHQ